MQIVPLNRDLDLFGVYATFDEGIVNDFGTYILFGPDSLEACLQWRTDNQDVINKVVTQ